MILSPAKINLTLQIKERLKNGYHVISSHMIFLDLFDRIFIENETSDFLKIVGPFKKKMNPSDRNNLILKTLKFCRKNKLTNDSFKITLEKNIPISAGLGGGSSNSASIIRYFLKHNKNEKVNKIVNLSKKLGADIPACLYSQPLLAKGIGEKISLINFNKNLDIGVVLINPNIQLSTKDVFTNFKFKENLQESFITQVDNFDDFGEFSIIGNDLKNTATRIVPEIEKILKIFENSNNCISYGMSGSGPTCFGIFKSKSSAFDFNDKFKNLFEINNFWFWSGGILGKSKRELILPL